MTPLEAAYRILDLAPGTAKDDVKRRYKLLVNVWHPDRQSRDDVRRFAEDKLKAITNAFGALEAAGFPGAAHFATKPRPGPASARTHPPPPRTATGRPADASRWRPPPRVASAGLKDFNPHPLQVMGVYPFGVAGLLALVRGESTSALATLFVGLAIWAIGWGLKKWLFALPSG